MKKIWILLSAVLFWNAGLLSVHAYQKSPEPSGVSQQFNKENKAMEGNTSTASLDKQNGKYEEKVRKELNHYRNKLKQFEYRAKNLDDKARVEVKDEMNELKGKMNLAREKLSSMKRAGGDAWERAKSEMDSAMDDVKETYERIASRFE